MTKVDLNISSRQEIVSIIGQLLAGYPDPANPPPPGRWDRLVVAALRRIYWVIPPGPNPQWRWQTILGPQPQPWVEVELNPQPLPPRTLFFTAIAQELIDRAQSIQETADAMASGEEQQGIIIVGGYVLSRSSPTIFAATGSASNGHFLVLLPGGFRKRSADWISL
jgi:hypothetical protein